MRSLPETVGVLMVALTFLVLATAQDLPVASVSGVVMNASSNAPFPGVLVMMAGGGVATTDDTGRFTLKDVRPGTWTIQALRTGTAPPARDSAPRVLTIKPGEEIRDVRLWLAPLATLRGRITDMDGNPLQGVQVEPLVVAYQLGSRILRTPEKPVGGPVFARTGGDGEYAMGVPPGQYYVAANYTETSRVQVSTSLGTVSVAGATRTYYPGTLDVELAAKVTLSGGDTGYADFKAFLKGPVLPKLSGTIVGARVPSAGLAAGPQVRTIRLIPRNVSGYIASSQFFIQARTNSPDSFEVRDVAKGSYDLVVDDVIMTDGRRGRGITPIEVGDRDIEDIVLILHPGQNIDGRIVVRGAANVFPLEEIAIRGGPPVVMASNDGTFILRNVLEGAQSIRVDGLPPDAYVADIRQGTVSLFDSARTLAGPQYLVSNGYSVPLEVIVGLNGGVIEGVVEGGANQNVAGSTVVLVPGPTRRFVPSYYRFATVGSAGDFRFQGLAPGGYQLYAWEIVPDTAWLNPDFMSSYEGRGQSVSVESGKHQSIRVRLIARED